MKIQFLQPLLDLCVGGVHTIADALAWPIRFNKILLRALKTSSSSWGETLSILSLSLVQSPPNKRHCHKRTLHYCLLPSSSSDSRRNRKQHTTLKKEGKKCTGCIKRVPRSIVSNLLPFCAMQQKVDVSSKIANPT